MLYCSFLRVLHTCVSLLLSQFIPSSPSPTPTIHTSLLTSVSLQIGSSAPCPQIPYRWLVHSICHFSTSLTLDELSLSYRVPFPKSLVRRKESGPPERGSHVSKAQNSETSCRAKGRAARRALGKYTSKKRWEMSESRGCFWLKEKNPVVMYGCESWTVKKAERPRIDAFELWCWRRLLRVPWTARRSNQSIQKEISPWCSWEGLMLKLKLQYFGHLI